jgi:hypothetical protein
MRVPCQLHLRRTYVRGAAIGCYSTQCSQNLDVCRCKRTSPAAARGASVPLRCLGARCHGGAAVPPCNYVRRAQFTRQPKPGGAQPTILHKLGFKEDLLPS